MHIHTAETSSMSQPLLTHDQQEGLIMATASQVHIETHAAVADAAPDMGTCDPKYWSCPGAAGYKVRGLTYLKVSA